MIFLTPQEQLTVWGKNNQMIHNRGNNQIGLLGKNLDDLVVVLINSGKWFNETSRSAAAENCVTIHSKD